MANPLTLPMIPRALRNLVSKPATRRYPYEIRPRFEGARGTIEFERGDVQLLHAVHAALPGRGDHGLPRELDLGDRALDLHRLQRVRRGVRQEEPEHVQGLQAGPYSGRSWPAGPASRPRGVAQAGRGTGRVAAAGIGHGRGRPSPRHSAASHDRHRVGQSPCSAMTESAGASPTKSRRC